MFENFWTVEDFSSAKPEIGDQGRARAIISIIAKLCTNFSGLYAHRFKLKQTSSLRREVCRASSETRPIS
jgi:hypothetical protein